ncbi:hypothetical protein [Macrococcus equipercicus]|uniref:Uncharacterized protein n=1 Tax=Macrococcus equipercicus TaxID=69967 RepID=A0A9Q9BSA2_9STAP|nr:hypothetical protein [Macrococcus equipercicus]UTH13011.1 hypothetical protein KFV11_06935 [Macrococcus equipercicus]
MEKYISFKHLLTKYNPRFTTLKIMKMQREIESLYDMSVCTIKIDEVKGWYMGGYSVEDLTFRIIEKKESLARFMERAERDYEDFQEASIRVKGNNFVVVNKYQRTGKMIRSDIYHLNTFIEALQQVREERRDKGYQCIEDYNELTPEQVQLLSAEIDSLTEYEIDFEAIKKDNFVKWWHVGYYDKETRREQEEFKAKLKAGDPEAIALQEHKEKCREREIKEAEAFNRAIAKERVDRSSTWIEDFAVVH